MKLFPKILLVLFAIGIVPMSYAIYQSTNLTQNRLLKEALLAKENSTELLRQQILLFVGSLKTRVTGFIYNQNFDSLSLEDLEDTVNLIISQNQELDIINILDESGRELLSRSQKQVTGLTDEISPLEMQEHLLQMDEAFVESTKHDGIRVGKVRTHGGKRFLTMAFPYPKNQRNLFGVIVMRINLEKVIDLLTDYSGGDSDEIGSLLVDGEGLPILTPEWTVEPFLPNPEKRMSLFDHPKKGQVYMGNNGKAYIGVLMEVGDSLPWNLLTYYEKDAALEAAYALRRQMSMLLGLIVLIVVVSSFFLSKKMVAPFRTLGQASRAYGQGEFDHEFEIRGKDEIAELGEEFKKMAEGLKDREFIRSTFGRYVSEDVMEDILSGEIALGGTKKEVTIVFTDIRGFTALSEDMDPTDLVELLNQYFTAMHGAIKKHGGDINKYMGDGILAIFGAPHALENASQSAVEASVDMLKALDDFNKDREVPLKIGIGIHTGEAVVGNLGSQERTEYTVIGDAVNLASRVESLTKLYGQTLLITDAVSERLSKPYLHKSIDMVKVVGKQKPVRLFSLAMRAKIEIEMAKDFSVINRVMSLYYKGDFSGALEHLQSNKGSRIKDTHLIAIAKRCKAFLKNPPANWDGVFEHKVK